MSIPVVKTIKYSD